MDNYSLRLEWSEEDEGYIATCPEFPGLSAFGETVEEAVQEAKTAVDLFIEDYNEADESLPEPEQVPEASGQTRVRMPKALHQDLKREAERQNTSLNSLIISYLQRSLGRDEVLAEVQEQRKELLECIRGLEDKVSDFRDQVGIVSAAAEMEEAQSVMDDEGSPQDPLLRSLKASDSKDY